MGVKSMTDLMIRFMSDEGFRCKMLHKEDTGLTEWGLPDEKRLDAIQLDDEKIIGHIVQEVTTAPSEKIEAWVKLVFGLGGVDLEAARLEIHESGVGPMDTSAYSEGAAHIRGIEPATLKAGVETLVELRGQGFTHDLTVKALGPGESIEAEIISQSCDIDLNQRVVVRVRIPFAGPNWELEVNPNFDGDAPATIHIEVVA